MSETYTEITSADFTIEEDQWVEVWQPTAQEGKYEIIVTAGNTMLKALVTLGFGYLEVMSFTHGGGG